MGLYKGVWGTRTESGRCTKKRASLAEIKVKFHGSTDCKVRGQSVSLHASDIPFWTQNLSRFILTRSQRIYLDCLQAPRLQFLFGMILKKLAGFAMSVPVREWFAMPRLTSGGVYNSDFYCFPPAGKTCWPCWNATCSFLFFASDVVDLVATRYVAFYLAITLPKSSTRCNISFQR